MPNKNPGFTIRHYCQGIGDCHLLRFEKADGNPYWMLIDCGIHTSIKGGSQIIDDIVADVFAVTKGQIDVLVLTHEHTDHISAFRASANRFADFHIDEVWMAWTESPTDPDAQKLDKFKQQALSALSGASRQLHGVAHLDEAKSAAPLREGIDELLAFSFGAQGETVRGMRDTAAGLAKKAIKYLEPAQAPLDIPSACAIRAYVLAPSRNPDYFNIVDRVGERYAMSSDENGLRIADTLSSAFAAAASTSDFTDLTAPFDPSLGTPLNGISRVVKPPKGPAEFAYLHYYGPSERAPLIASKKRVRTTDANETNQAWRRIDYDWLSSAGSLAMQLDNKINNTSLVLAFEIVDTGRVFLFAADAQIGNWLSWQDANWKMSEEITVTGPDLLNRTVYYKVGHHGSENATAKAKGLELMTSKDLTAFIPTNKADAENVHWGEMPYHSLLTALDAQCGPRVIRADDPKLLAGQAPFATPSGSIQAVRVGFVGKGGDQRRTWVEFDVA
ncbi:MBL fold metallo-hydrolase [Pseudomonas botevensis]|uniref:MBL fold metallo-hydrolase n=1 Tax=Pseudomonas botevensis TaxID=2842352 RepID=UPI001C3C214D|nr:MBL fold metallo-hydrolase [Pseudomonas botevensis]MBV4476890.1 MBL fold metallo-hydrolase [Pseudomonas botevensis]